VEHAVGALPPLKLIVPGVPWHTWHPVRSDFASVPWKPVPGLSQVPPVICGAANWLWHIVPLKQPGAVPAGAGDVGIVGLFGFTVPVKAWQRKHTEAFAEFVEL
jgi:hypothetical protein